MSINGPMTIPVTFVVTYKVLYLFTSVTAYDPKMNGYLVECQHWILGLAVLAIATVPKRKTGANAQTTDLNNPNS